MKIYDGYEKRFIGSRYKCEGNTDLPKPKPCPPPTPADQYSGSVLGVGEIPTAESRGDSGGSPGLAGGEDGGWGVGGGRYSASSSRTFSVNDSSDSGSTHLISATSRPWLRQR